MKHHIADCSIREYSVCFIRVVPLRTQHHLHRTHVTYSLASIIALDISIGKATMSFPKSIYYGSLTTHAPSTLPVKCNSFKFGSKPSVKIAESDNMLYDIFNIYKIKIEIL